jgi:hypothetical protein
MKREAEGRRRVKDVSHIIVMIARGLDLDLEASQYAQCVAPIPGRPCLTGLYEMENSAK